MTKKYKGISPKIGENVYIAENAMIIGEVKVGNNCGIWFNVTIRGDVNYIKIGNRSNVQDGCIIHVTHSKTDNREDGFPTVIGDDVTIGHKAMLHGCKIGDACLIGMNSTLLDGCEIGEESIVAAGSVVTQNKKFPPRSLIMGVPAKVVRKLTDEEVKNNFQSAKNYVKYKNEYLGIER